KSKSLFWLRLQQRYFQDVLLDSLKKSLRIFCLLLSIQNPVVLPRRCIKKFAEGITLAGILLNKEKSASRAVSELIKIEPGKINCHFSKMVRMPIRICAIDF